MDATSFGIILGAVAGVIFAVKHAVKRASFDAGVTFLVFLAGFSIPVGIELIVAGFRGDLLALPSSWREYISVAGIISIGFGADYLIKACFSGWVRESTTGPVAISEETVPEETVEVAGSDGGATRVRRKRSKSAARKSASRLHREK